MLSLEQAVGGSPSLALLQERIRTSQHCLQLVRPLIPPALRQHVKAGPIQDNEWCILVASAAASTKLRQLLPAMQQVLIQNGAQVNAIRIKVQIAAR
ncbi:MAG: DciA family protein [Hydrogenophaga sp.]|uniref:DciA family protein n=1 Tax=Hydrogenophaga sp. TaxID=1904254 RepID=UPI00272F632D|nr:DciA family protein [Hydrogenophaga sp.]MDP2164973.1 DciA family protein [Hydrogenophaga sp.]MDP3477856.1 DciA family protein [Hydrogenophaga sp.]